MTDNDFPTKHWRKSSYSGNSGNCVEVNWRKSSYSGEAGNCVEVAATPTAVGVRDSNTPAKSSVTRRTGARAGSTGSPGIGAAARSQAPCRRHCTRTRATLSLISRGS